jgi:hypothetical protein
VNRRGLAAALLLLPGALAAQNPRRVFSGVEFRSMSYGDGYPGGTSSVSALALPFGVILPVSRRLSLDVSARYASATWEDTAGTTATISGLTDTQVRAAFQIVPDVLVFTVSGNLPTGNSTITEAQLPAASAIAHDLIPFPVSSFGTGASVTSGLAFAVPLGGWAIGVGGSYRMSGTYRMFSDVADTAATQPFRPGAEMRLRVGLDRLVGQGRLALGVTYSSFAIDELGDVQILRPGNRFLTQGSWSFPLGSVGVGLYAWNLYRSAGSEVQSGATTERQNLLTVGGTASIQLGRSQLRPLVEYRRHWADDAQGAFGAAGALLSLGTRLLLPLGDRFALLPGVRYDVGNVADEAGGNASVSGLSVSATLRANW